MDCSWIHLIPSFLLYYYLVCSLTENEGGVKRGRKVTANEVNCLLFTGNIPRGGFAQVARKSRDIWALK